MFIVKLANEVYELQGWEPPARGASTQAKPTQQGHKGHAEAPGKSSGSTQKGSSKPTGQRRD